MALSCIQCHSLPGLCHGKSIIIKFAIFECIREENLNGKGLGKTLELVERNGNLSAGSRCRVRPLELSVIGELLV